LLRLPTFSDEGALHVVVESPRGSAAKFRYDPDLGAMALSRPLPGGLVYPHDWGFVPSTKAADGDPLDALIAWDGISYPGVVIACRAIGVLRVEQTNKTSRKRERNDRLVVMPADAPRWNTVRTIADLGERTRIELEQFFLAAVAFEGKQLALLGWGGPSAAMTLVRASGRGSRRGRSTAR
jgi:inorganic pyrophosphatase